MTGPLALTIVTVVDGEFDVTVNDQLVRVFVPPGLGVAGVDDETFVVQVLTVLAERATPLPSVLDLAQVVARQPQLLQQISDTLDNDEADTV
ncbi:MAG: hypothetical protein WD360_03530 [Nitriliruptoraceae bacterium]